MIFGEEVGNALKHVTGFDIDDAARSFLEMLDDYYTPVNIIIAVAYLCVLIYFSARSSGIRRRFINARRSRQVVLLVFAGSACVFAALVTTDRIWRTGIPVPLVLEAPKAVIGEEHFIQWKPYEVAAGKHAYYELQQSSDILFRDGSEKTYTFADTLFPLYASENKTWYWRMRVVVKRTDNTSLSHYGPWTDPIRVAQYSSAFERIRDTRELIVSMDQAYGRTEFRYLKKKATSHTGAPEPSQTSVFAGIEPEIAYHIADALCDKFFNDKSKFKCTASRDGPSKSRSCGAQECVHIAVRFIAVPWDKLFDSIGRGEADMALSTFVKTPGRETKKHIHFSSGSYHTASYAFLGRVGAVVGGKIELHGKRIVVEEGTTSKECLEWLSEHLDPLRKHYFSMEVSDRLYNAPRTLRDKGGPDFIFTARTYAERWAQNPTNGAELIEVPNEIKDAFSKSGMPHCEKLEYRIAVGAGETDLSAIIDNRLEWLSGEDGGSQLEKIKESAYEEFRRQQK